FRNNVHVNVAAPALVCLPCTGVCSSGSAPGGESDLTEPRQEFRGSYTDPG
ncbi:uncharacterized protein V6R79_000299, partial [Siganus canaliculatus]